MIDGLEHIYLTLKNTAVSFERDCDGNREEDGNFSQIAGLAYNQYDFKNAKYRPQDTYVIDTVGENF